MPSYYFLVPYAAISNNSATKVQKKKHAYNTHVCIGIDDAYHLFQSFFHSLESDSKNVLFFIRLTLPNQRVDNEWITNKYS